MLRDSSEKVKLCSEVLSRASEEFCRSSEDLCWSSERFLPLGASEEVEKWSEGIFGAGEGVVEGRDGVFGAFERRTRLLHFLTLSTLQLFFAHQT